MTATGPLLPLTMPDQCCGAARRSGLSLQMQNLRWVNSHSAGLFRLSLHLQNWIGLKASADNKGGFRTFAAPASVLLSHS